MNIFIKTVNKEVLQRYGMLLAAGPCGQGLVGRVLYKIITDDHVMYQDFDQMYSGEVNGR